MSAISAHQGTIDGVRWCGARRAQGAVQVLGAAIAGGAQLCDECGVVEADRGTVVAVAMLEALRNGDQIVEFLDQRGDVFVLRGLGGLGHGEEK